MVSKYPKGSEWRCWDLQVHTPESVLNNQFGTDWDRYVQELLVRAVRSNIAVVGVTDYFSIAGYKRLQREYLEDRSKLSALLSAELRRDPDFLERVSRITFLPNIELRIAKLAGSKRLTFHVLFSDSVQIEDIEQNFLHALQFTYKGAAGQSDERHTLTKDNLERLGRRLKAEHEAFRRKSDLEVGCVNAAVADEEVAELLVNRRTIFGNGYVLVLAEERTSELRWDGQDHQLRKVLLQKADFVFSSNPQTRDVCLSKEFAVEFGGRKACVWGSDAHDYETLFRPADDRYFWVKADPTFQGLLQLRHEPAVRSYIGVRPPLLETIERGNRQYLDRLRFGLEASAKLSEKWFAGQEIPLNPELVVIIGNKGSGKSALADSLALIGNASVDPREFSFLNATRFCSRDPSTGDIRAKHFYAEGFWADGHRQKYNLNDRVRPSVAERVRYLPQGYVERICASPDPDDRERFETELDRVIFSHVPDAERLKTQSLPELVDKRSAAFRQTLSEVKSRIRQLNRRVIELEFETSGANLEKLRQAVTSRQRELLQLETRKPEEVKEPPPPTDLAIAARLSEMGKIQKRLERLAGQRSKADASLAELTELVSGLQQAEEKFKSAARQVAALKREVAADLQAANLRVDDLVKLEINIEPLQARLRELDAERARLRDSIFGEKGLQVEQQALEVRSRELRTLLDAPTQRHQRYKSALADWEQQRKALIGEPEVEGTIANLEARLARAGGPAKAEQKVTGEARDAATAEAFDLLDRLASVQRQLYQPVQDFIDRSQKAGRPTGLEVGVALEGAGFVTGFFDLVSQKAAGSFYGERDGRLRLTELLGSGRFSSAAGLLKFLSDVEGALRKDLRRDGTPATDIDKQLRQDIDRKDVYDFLYTLEWLQPVYGLRLRGKPFEQLSPGERGLLLLTFYLAVDRETSPLIMDQPEENLDNQSVMELLVSTVREAKQRRQLIIVTHNPNLAVVCDAEQVIYASLEQAGEARISYDAGSLEDGVLNRHVVDVLEGTAPAFQIRHGRYRSVGSVE